MKNQTRNPQKGFTLIELVVVIIIIAILVAFGLPKLIGATTGAKAQALTVQSNALGQNLGLLATTCGVSSAVAGNPLATAGKSVVDVLLSGKTAAAAAYQSCFDQAHIRPLGDQFKQSGATWSLQGFPITLSGGGTVPLQVQYQSVPDDVTLALVQARDASKTVLDASDTTSPFLQYSVANADSTRTVTLFIP